MSDEMVRLWAMTRRETMELLESLNDEKLLFVPEGAKWQPLYYQFACMARSQLVYVESIKAEKMDFSFFKDPGLPDKHANKTKAELKQLLETADVSWRNVLSSGVSVLWGDEAVSINGQIARMVAHERLHHGQLISYFTLAGFEFPESFKMNWAL